ncbi:hypothetical protein VST63_19165 [Mycolicibacterium sp. 050232]|uniref:hypothetical protein n=1 Tax=Mycolicibacterium sp. 050232 TaxID=3113982 RepID=UPI002E2DC7AB|nr:hypothetical protein [Mycolicibacterium sp. 050232]MED5814482.1 hypothetical protein [Mycolicibacterium sp. 050232]
MSGKLVGAVYTASPRLRAQGLSRNAFLALLAIAEKCHHETGQGCIRWDHICDGLYGASKSTAKRAVRELRGAGLIDVVQPGWANQHEAGHAPIYVLRMVPPLTPSTTPRITPPVTPSTELDRVRTDLDGVKSDLDRTKHPPLTSGDPTLDGSIDGSIDGGGRAGARNAQPPSRSPAPATPSPQSSESHYAAPDGASHDEDPEAIAEAIRASLAQNGTEDVNPPPTPPTPPRFRPPAPTPDQDPRIAAKIRAARANLDRATTNSQPNPDDPDELNDTPERERERDRAESARFRLKRERHLDRIAGIDACQLCDTRGTRDDGALCWHGGLEAPA